MVSTLRLVVEEGIPSPLSGMLIEEI